MVCWLQLLKEVKIRKLHLFIVMTLALSALPATPVAVLVIGNTTEGLL